MKTIQVTDEVYKFLKSCQDELNTQDNRITANPIFGFKEKFKTASYDPQEFEFVSEDHDYRIADTAQEGWESDIAEYIFNQYDSIHDVREFLNDTFMDTAWPVYQQYSDDDVFEEELKKDFIQYIKNLQYYEYENFAEECNIKVYGYEKQYRMYEYSVSLFESDMQAHINMNKHNMGEYYTYVYSNQRTPKMTKLREILMKEIKFNG